MKSFLLPLSLMLLTAPALAEDPVFRVDTELVAVDVQVMSRNSPVTNLRREDFRIWDEGEAQSIVSMGRDEVELELLFLIDVSGSTLETRTVILQSAAQAMSHLHFRDRVGVVVFNSQAYLISAPTWDRMKILKLLSELPSPQGGTELNTVLRNTAQYLKKQSRPAARRVIVVLTDNVAYETSTDSAVQNDLWETDTMVNAVLFKPVGVYGGPAYSGDVRTFVRGTGGETLNFRAGTLPLVELFERLRKRYVLLYRPPADGTKAVRKIRVDLSDEAKKRHKDLTIRARRGYVARTADAR